MFKLNKKRNSCYIYVYYLTVYHFNLVTLILNIYIHTCSNYKLKKKHIYTLDHIKLKSNSYTVSNTIIKKNTNA